MSCACTMHILCCQRRILLVVIMLRALLWERASHRLSSIRRTLLKCCPHLRYSGHHHHHHHCHRACVRASLFASLANCPSLFEFCAMCNVNGTVMFIGKDSYFGVWLSASRMPLSLASTPLNLESMLSIFPSNLEPIL